jgi:hypothetical protein
MLIRQKISYSRSFGRLQLVVKAQNNEGLDTRVRIEAFQLAGDRSPAAFLFGSLAAIPRMN